MQRKPKSIKPMTTPKPIAEQLREAMREAQEAGRSLHGIARDSDLSVPVVHKFSHGGNINLESAEKLAQGLGVKVLTVPPKG